ncbi:DUF3703 domain-containing protein [Streptomyces sp. MK37H]|uniref:DUF3703 domain-containing protein n=1 Tax=Streptomyces sp. MK37H TaxID=2699117 RepID=UPI001B39C6A3|nr:DUF3703 domain-containing protein [Streptomyces sp. MK37H]
MTGTTFETEMQQGRGVLTARDFRSAYRHFGRAHNIGHDVFAHHLAAHRGLLSTAWRQRRLDRVATQCFLLAIHGSPVRPQPTTEDHRGRRVGGLLIRDGGSPPPAWRGAGAPARVCRGCGATRAGGRPGHPSS